MEQPLHSVRSHIGAGSTTTGKRAGGIMSVVLIQGGLVALLVLGMHAGEIQKKLENLQTTVEQKEEVKVPPPPPPDTVKPPPPFIPPPEFTVTTDAPAPTNAITTTQVRPQPAPPPPPAGPPPTKLEAVMRTHTTPPYPPISIRLGEQGTTTLMVTISANGDVTDAQVQKTSGSNRLDAAAVEFVKAKWKWKPPTQEGKPVEARTLVAVQFNLKDAQ